MIEKWPAVDVPDRRRLLAAAGRRRGAEVGPRDGAARHGRHGRPDIGWEIRKRRYVERPNSVLKVADKIAERGRFGQKTGRAGTCKAGSRKPIPSEVEKIIADTQEAGVKTRQIPRSSSG
jgi:hypothetical protein